MCCTPGGDLNSNNATATTCRYLVPDTCKYSDEYNTHVQLSDGFLCMGSVVVFKSAIFKHIISAMSKQRVLQRPDSATFGSSL